MAPLHELPNGIWIDLTAVNRIAPYPETIQTDPSMPSRVIVAEGDSIIMFTFADFSDARRYAGELAASVNVARTR